ncbi:hypothetical protein D3C76_1204650 [compost metagenome]
MYWPRTTWVVRPSGLIGARALSTLTFSSRMLSADRSAGGSMAIRQSSCSRWFWIMSRSWPALSKYPQRPSIPTFSATVISTWEM